MKIGAWRLFKTSVASAVEHRAVLVRVLAIPFALSLVGTTFQIWSSPTPAQLYQLSAEEMSALMASKLGNMAFWIPYWLVMVGVSIMAGVSWCRYALGVEVDAPWYRSDFLRALRVFEAGFKVFLFCILPYALVVIGIALAKWLSSLVLSVGVAVMSISVLAFVLIAFGRLIVVLPMAAMDEDVHVFELFSQRRGQAWSVCGASLILFVFMLIVYLPLQFFLLYFGANVTVEVLLAANLVLIPVQFAATAFNLCLAVNSFKVWLTPEADAVV